MSKKIKKIEQPKKNFQHGDQVMYSSIGIRSTVIGKSVTEKGVYILELHDGTLETAHGDELELVDFVREYDDGVKDGEKYAINIREEILVDVRDFASERSHDYAQGYLSSVTEILSDLPDVLAHILDKDEEE